MKADIRAYSTPTAWLCTHCNGVYRVSLSFPFQDGGTGSVLLSVGGTTTGIGGAMSVLASSGVTGAAGSIVLSSGSSTAGAGAVNVLAGPGAGS